MPGPTPAPDARLAVDWRQAGASDVAPLLALMREFYAVDGDVFDMTLASRAVRDLLGDPFVGRVWLIMAEGTCLAGYVAMTFGFSLVYGGRDALIDELYVRPAFQRRGLAAATLAFVEQEALAAGAHALHLEVRSGNDRARSIYERAGFVAHEARFMSKKLR